MRFETFSGGLMKILWDLASMGFKLSTAFRHVDIYGRAEYYTCQLREVGKRLSVWIPLLNFAKLKTASFSVLSAVR